MLTLFDHLDSETRPTDLRKSADKYRPPNNPKTVRLHDLLKRISRNNATEAQGRLLSDDDLSSMIKTPELYYQGDLTLLERSCVAIVGTRKVSRDGAARARRLARGLVEAGVVVVSGLADGVDAVAHRSAIEAGGKTVGVIGTPLEKAYPAKNKHLQEEIYKDHLLISQFRSGERTFRSSFPLRNQLMATLTDATVVIEASDTSGTLHQAVACTRLGRWLFIAQSVIDDPAISWPAKFLQYERCIALKDIRDVTDRVCT